MDSLVVFSPAKVNFMLAVTGRRADGFHDIVSIVAPITFGDSVRLQRLNDPDDVRFACDDPAVPTGADNLAVRAVAAFRAATGSRDGISIELTKRIPMGAGLGGGSSNAVAVLRGLNVLHGSPLSDDELVRVAATLGSDCPLFLAGGVCLIRGRGELLTHLTPQKRHRFAKIRLLVFKPDFGVSTPWAYARLAATSGAYFEPATAEARVSSWFDGRGGVAELLFNSFEPVVFRKFCALSVLVEKLRARSDVEGVLLSGSGSACFALLRTNANSAETTALIHAALGPYAFVQEALVA
jgi:4-diphosphocytidyl-2-C-methyl-D-erythritol kinase